MTDTCRSCPAEVIFVPSAKTGKPMILDAKPAKGVVLEDIHPDPEIPEWTEQRARVVDVYTDHHVTCPKAGEWRGRTRKRAPA